MSEPWKRLLRKWHFFISLSGERVFSASSCFRHSKMNCSFDCLSLYLFFCVSPPLSRGLPASEAEMLYMQEVEKMEGYGQESFQAKVN